MGKFISISYKSPSLVPENLEEILKNLSASLLPKNFKPEPDKFLRNKTTTTILINPSPTHQIHQASACVGVMTKKTGDWYKPDGEVPDGNFALIRANNQQLQIVSDTISTRTIWYYFNDEFFITSSSQKAIISFIGSFEPNVETYTWFLMNGYHGPQMGWDKRIKCLETNQSSISLYYDNWQIEKNVNPIIFKPLKLKAKNYYSYFHKEFQKILQNMEINFPRWSIGISGGYDSRAIMLLAQNKGFKSITWGLSESMKEVYNDAVVGQRLAASIGMQHKYYPIQSFSIPFSEIFERFILVGEGRVDKIAGYLDGFELWNDLKEDQIWGIVRGEIPGSQHPFANSVQEAFNYSGVEKLDHVFPLELIEQWGLIPQKLPTSFEIREGETFMAYQDRLNHSFRIPTYHGGLNDLKTGFLEVLQPLLLNKSIQLFRSIPDDFRTHKLLIKKIVKEISPKIGFASSDSLEKFESVIRKPEVVEFIEQILRRPSSSKYLSPNLIDFLLNNLDHTSPPTELFKRSFFKKLKRLVKAFLPNYLVRLLKRLIHLRNKKDPTIDINKMALRACIIIKMNEVLNETAEKVKKGEISKVKI